MNNRKIAYSIAALAVVILGAVVLRFELPLISVAPETLFHIGSFPVTNSYLTSWVVIILTFVGMYIGTRDMQLIPSSWQNLLEAVIEGLYNLTESICGPEWVKKFYFIPISIFVYVLVSNYFGLLFFVPAIGVCQAVHHGDEQSELAHVDDAEVSGDWFKLGTTCGEDEHLVPFFRSPSADLNNTLMLALFTQVAAQVFGIMALGFGGYLAKFFVFGSIAAAFRPDSHGNKRTVMQTLGALAMGLIDLAVGLLEFISEFVKVIAYTFRLFGNIFAGEVMLIVLTFLIPIGLAVPFYAFEVFVGLIQAFVFYVLSVAFYTVAITPAHHDEGH